MKNAPFLLVYHKTVGVSSRHIALDLNVAFLCRRQKRLWPFLELSDRGVGHITLDLSVIFLCRREKRQFVFGTVTATCHPEGARRASRSFAEGAKRMEQNRDLR